VSSAGDVAATVTVTLRNNAPASGFPHYVIGGSGPDPTPDGVSRSYVTLYSPLALRDATVDGRHADFDVARELGRNAFSAFVVVPSQQTVTLRLRLSGRVDLAGDHDAREYALHVWRQPTIRPDDIDVVLRGPAGRRAEARVPPGFNGHSARLRV
jgi:hypothetical protein